MNYVEITLPDYDYLELGTLSDIHQGNPAFDYVAWRRAREWVLADEHRRVVLNGDALEAAIKDSVGDVYDSLSPQAEIEWLHEELFPIKDRILLWNEGNHDQRIRRVTGVDACAMLAREFGIPYSRGGTVLVTRFGARPSNGKPLVYAGYFVHGWGGGRRPGSVVNQAEDLFRAVSVDYVVISHHHKPLIYKFVQLVPDTRNRKLVEKERLLVASSSFLGYAEYAEKVGLVPTSHAFPVIRLDGHEYRMSAAM